MIRLFDKHYGINRVSESTFQTPWKNPTPCRYHAFWRRAVWYAFMNFFWKDLSKHDTWCIVLFLIFKIPRLPHWLSGNPRGIKLNLSMRWNVECQFFWKVIKIKLNNTSLALTQRFRTISIFSVLFLKICKMWNGKFYGEWGAQVIIYHLFSSLCRVYFRSHSLLLDWKICCTGNVTKMWRKWWVLKMILKCFCVAPEYSIPQRFFFFLLIKKPSIFIMTKRFL